MNQNKLILASASPRRKDLLDRCGVAFEVIKPEVEELFDCRDLRRLPLLNAVKKAEEIAKSNTSYWVLGADTVIYLNGRIYGKPKDLSSAHQMLKVLSGKPHEVLTGIALIHLESKISLQNLVSTTVWFKELSDEVIAEYLSKVDVLDKAGSYAIQECGDLIIERIDGGLDNVIGLPVPELKQMLIRAGLITLANL